MLNGTYLLATLTILCLAVWPEETQAVLVSTSLKIQIYWINYRMKWQAYRMYRSIVKMSKEMNLPHPGEFRFVNIWDREPLD